jgi:parallel beta-helix repeat protein
MSTSSTGEGEMIRSLPTSLLRSFLIGFLCLVAVAGPSTAATSARTLFVNDDGTPGQNTGCDRPFSATIGEAVAAAGSGDTIQVCAGTYDEQVAVTTDDLRISGAGADRTTIRPTVASINTVALRTGLPSVAILLVDGSRGVTIRGLTVDGSAATLPSDCPPYFGVFYRTASGVVEAVRVTGIVPCVSVGIFVQSPVDGSGSANVTIRESAVDDYGSNGIICNELGTDCAIKNNLLVGRGDVPDSFPAGIQIGFDARGKVSENVVRGNLCTLDFCGADPLTQAQASGILAFRARQGTVISHNRISGNDAGIYLVESAGCCRTSENRLVDNRFLAIGVQDGSNTTSDNEITGGNYGVVALAFVVDTIATSRADEIRRVAIAPTRAFSCCGVSAEVIRRQ